MSNDLHELIDVMNEEYSRIDRRAEREKQEITYIIELVQKDYDELAEVASSDNKRTLFDLVRKALKQTVDNFKFPHVGIFYGDLERVREAVLLGWIEMKINIKNEYSFYDKRYFYLTDPGRKVIEDYYNFKEHL